MVAEQSEQGTLNSSQVIDSYSVATYWTNSGTCNM